MTDEKQLRVLFPRIFSCSDNDLEGWLTFYIREAVEAKLKKRDGLLAKLWCSALSSEVNRRKYLARHGAPKYNGKDDIGPGMVSQLREYFKGDAFVNLFADITNFEVVFRGKWKYHCQIHGDDKEPSGMLYDDQGRWHCFGCGHGGDIFALLMEFPPHRTFPEAVRYLKERAYGKAEV